MLYIDLFCYFVIVVILSHPLLVQHYYYIQWLHYNCVVPMNYDSNSHQYGKFLVSKITKKSSSLRLILTSHWTVSNKPFRAHMHISAWPSWSSLICQTLTALFLTFTALTTEGIFMYHLWDSHTFRGVKRSSFIYIWLCIHRYFFFSFFLSCVSVLY